MDIQRSIVKLFSAKLASRVVGFIGLTFFARELGAEQMGIFFLFQAVLSLLALPADLGIREGIEKRISEDEYPDNILTTGLLLKLGLALLLGLAVLVSRRYVNEYIGGRVAVLLVIALVLNALSTVAIRTLKGELRVGEIGLLQFSRQVVWVGGGAVLIWAGLEYRGIIYSMILGLGVVFVWGMGKRSTPFGTPSREHASSLWAYSKYSFVGAVGGSFYSWLDVAVIGFFLTQSHVGAYEMAWRIGLVVSLLSNTIATTIFPQVSEWDAREQRNRIENLLPNALASSFFFVGPAFFGSLLLSKEILGLLFGNEYVIAQVVLIMFMAFNFVNAITGIVARVLRAIDHPALVAKARVVSVSVNLVLNIILVQQFGITGAAVATGLAITVYTLLITRFLNNYIAITFPYYEVGWYILASVGMATVIGGIQYVVQINTVPELLGVVGLGAAVYFLLIVANESLRGKLLRNARRVAG